MSAAVQQAKEALDKITERARGVLFTDHPLANEWRDAYDTWIRARWDEGDPWVRSVWVERP